MAANQTNGKPPVDIDRIFAEGKPIEDALARAFRDAVIQHRQNGVPMVFWQDGKVTLVPADQVDID